jgi:uncharacterized protein (DUF362 family)
MQAPLTRRQFVAGAIALSGAAGCGRRPAPGSEPKVSVVRASYGADLLDRVRRLFVDHGVTLRGKRVVLKPNLVEFDSATAINTSPALVLAVLEACRALGAGAVRIAEGPGHRRTTWDLAEAAGYFTTIPDFEAIFTDLNLDEISEVALPRSAKGLHSLWLPRTALDCDLLISLPKMKTHHWAGVTLGMKNLFGLVPGAVYGWPKNVLHWAGIDESIVAVNSAVPNMFTIVDGVEGMEGNGPIQGRRKHAGVLVAGADRVAVDATCCRVMGVNPELVRHLRLAQTVSQTQEANVRQIGERLDAVRTDFELVPEFGALRLKTS